MIGSIPRAAVLLGAFSLCVAAVQTVPPPPTPPWPYTIGATATKGQASYLDIVLTLEERRREAEADREIRSAFASVHPTSLALAGEYREAAKWAPPASAQEAMQAVDLAGYRPTDAVRAILTASERTRIVLLNEEHGSSQQRAFANRLLGALRARGYTHLAVEALQEDPATLSARGYPLLNSGLYIQDPSLGDLLRRAVAMGFKLVRYDTDFKAGLPQPGDRSPIDAVNRRERAQAQSIYDQSLARAPGAKVVVFAGRHHIAEGPRQQGGGEWRPMGLVLKELSRVDPLSIDLMTMREGAAPTQEHAARRAALAAGYLTRGPAVLINGRGAFWSANPGLLDAYVFHPSTREIGGRPDWMRMGGLRKTVPVRPPFGRKSTPYLLQAHISSESSDAVPVDQTIVRPGTASATLMLRPGHYRVQALDRSGARLWSRSLRVRG